jgi:hypothetical protein
VRIARFIRLAHPSHWGVGRGIFICTLQWPVIKICV